MPAYARIAAIHLQAHRLDSARATLNAGLVLTRAQQRTHPEAHLQLIGLEGWYYAETDQPEQSVRVAREILALHHRTNAPLADVALAERILGSQCLAVGDFDCATDALTASLGHYRRVFGPDNRYTALVLGHLAETHAFSGRDALADTTFRHALAMKQRYFGPADAELGYTLHAYGRHAHAQGRVLEADTLLAGAERIWAQARAPGDGRLLITRATRALVRHDLGDRRAAADTLEAIWRRAGGGRRDRSWAVLALAFSELRRRQGRAAEADSILREATPLLRRSPFRRVAGG